MNHSLFSTNKNLSVAVSTFLFSLLVSLIQTHSAQAQVTPAPTPYLLYQTQTIIGLNVPLRNGTSEYMLGVISPKPGEFKLDLVRDGMAVDIPSVSYVYQERTSQPTMIGKGANYAVFKGADGCTVVSANVNGGLSRLKLLDTQEPDKDGYGGVYFVTQNKREIVLIDSEGNIMPTLFQAPKLKMRGGNYFIDDQNRLTTFKALGNETPEKINVPYRPIGMMYTIEGFTYPSAKIPGGNYFINEDPANPKVHTVQTISSVNGLPYAPEPLPAPVVLAGGNYFITENNLLYTVDYQGLLSTKPEQLSARPTVLGYSYFIFADDTFRIVTADGVAHSQMVMVSPTNIEFNLKKTLSPSMIIQR
jgi:hypothetical protein